MIDPSVPIDDIHLLGLTTLVPGPEYDDAYVLLLAADSLEGFVRDFEMAVKLFDMASTEAQPLLEADETIGKRLDSIWRGGKSQPEMARYRYII
jgi:hypothetical protein